MLCVVIIFIISKNNFLGFAWALCYHLFHFYFKKSLSYFKPISAAILVTIAQKNNLIISSHYEETKKMAHDSQIFGPFYAFA